MTPLPRAVTDPGELLELYGRDRDRHPYGLADVAQLWDRSAWWRSGDAAVGLLELPGPGSPVVYAIAADPPHGDPAGTIALLAQLAPVLPPRFEATAPPGSAQALAPHRTVVRAAAYRKQALLDRTTLPPPDPRPRVLSVDDLAALEALLGTDPDAGGFFHPGLLASGAYLGMHDDGRLLAAAGIHVLDPVTRVAAVGNVVTYPDARRRGLAAATVATLCHRLLDRVEVVGLNVAARNLGARRLYERLGFRDVGGYEELLVAPRGGAAGGG